MRERFTFVTSLGIGLVVTFIVTVAGFVVAFVTRADLSVPGVVDISSTPAGTAPSIEFVVNPVAASLLVLFIATAIWSAARLGARRRSPQAQ